MILVLINSLNHIAQYQLWAGLKVQFEIQHPMPSLICIKAVCRNTVFIKVQTVSTKKFVRQDAVKCPCMIFTQGNVGPPGKKGAVGQPGLMVGSWLICLLPG